MEPKKPSRQILVADDEAIVRNAAKAILRRAGFEALLASDGVEAVDIFRKNAESIVLVLLDVHMPQKNGIDALSEILAMRPDAKIVLSSGYSEEDVRKSLGALPVAAFAQKPYSVDELLAVIRATLEG